MAPAGLKKHFSEKLQRMSKKSKILLNCSKMVQKRCRQIHKSSISILGPFQTQVVLFKTRKKNLGAILFRAGVKVTILNVFVEISRKKQDVIRSEFCIVVDLIALTYMHNVGCLRFVNLQRSVTLSIIKNNLFFFLHPSKTAPS